MMVAWGGRFLRLVLPPVVVAAAWRVRRRLRLLAMALSSDDSPLSDGVVELRLIVKRDLERRSSGRRVTLRCVGDSGC
jgi:putative component of toxin-antitoxin plasmid stabilization module